MQLYYLTMPRRKRTRTILDEDEDFENGKEEVSDCEVMSVTSVHSDYEPPPVLSDESEVPSDYQSDEEIRELRSSKREIPNQHIARNNMYEYERVTLADLDRIKNMSIMDRILYGNNKEEYSDITDAAYALFCALEALENHRNAPSKTICIKALSLLEKRAEEHCRISQARLGYMYAEGEFVEKDVLLAYSYLEKAVEKRKDNMKPDLHAHYILGTLAEDAADYEDAYRNYLLSAKQGHCKAKERLGVLLIDGAGDIDMDIPQALTYWREADTDVANGWIAYCKYMGVGLERDEETAKEELRILSLQGVDVSHHVEKIENAERKYRTYILNARTTGSEQYTKLVEAVGPGGLINLGLI